jgi:hypothetical protein
LRRKQILKRKGERESEKRMKEKERKLRRGEERE